MGIIFRNGIKYSGTRVVDDADHLFAEDTTGTSVSAQTMLSNILGDFATTEDSVAQENHSVGDYIVLGSYFYKVTDAITAGDTLVEGVNGNIERTNVGAEVNKLDPKIEAITFNSTYVSTTYDNRVSKIGNAVFYHFLVKTNSSIGSGNSFGTLPHNVKFRADTIIFNYTTKAPLTACWLEANTTQLKVNGATSIPASTDIFAQGFYITD